MNAEQDAITKLEAKGYKVEPQADGRVLVHASAKRGTRWVPNCGCAYFPSARWAYGYLLSAETQA